MSKEKQHGCVGSRSPCIGIIPCFQGSFRVIMNISPVFLVGEPRDVCTVAETLSIILLCNVVKIDFMVSTFIFI